MMNMVFYPGWVWWWWLGCSWSWWWWFWCWTRFQRVSNVWRHSHICFTIFCLL